MYLQRDNGNHLYQQLESKENVYNNYFYNLHSSNPAFSKAGFTVYIIVVTNICDQYHPKKYFMLP